MVLHIALDGIDGVGKTTQIQKLQEFFTNKSYKVLTKIQPACNEIIDILKHYNLTTWEIALLMAFDRSFSYYMDDYSKYDIVFWDRSILSSYAYNTDDTVTSKWIQTINRFMPEMDLYIIIRTDEYIETPDYTSQNHYDLIKKYDELNKSYKNTITVPYLKNKPEIVLENIIKIIFEKLPTCEWCGRLFTKNKHNKKYCSKKCKKYAKEEQNRINALEFYHKYKDTLSERRKGALGSYGANLKGGARTDSNEEYRLIQNEKKRIGI